MGWLDEIAAQKDRLFLWVPVAFGAGIAAYFSLLGEPSYEATSPFFFLLLPATFLLYRRHHDNLWYFFGYLIAAALLLATLGFAAAQIGTLRYGTPMLDGPTGARTITGTIETMEPLSGKKGARVVLTDMEIEKISPERTPKRVRISFRKSEGLKAGARIETLASLSPPGGPVAPDAYDFRRHFFFEGIGGVGFAYKPPRIIEEETHPGFFESLRERINTAIRAKAGPVAEGIMAALITGQRAAIAEEDDDAMRESGLYHLLSISGAHVAMVAGLLFFLSRFLMACFPWLALHWPIKKIAAVIALSGAAFYVFLAGAEVPALRSLFMTGFVLVAVMADRSPLSLRLIAVAALFILAIVPHALAGVSFQMSFSAVAALICFFDYVRPWWMKMSAQAGFLRKSGLYLLGIFLTSIIAGSVTGLFSLYHFQSFSLYGVAANMIAVPLTGIVIMPAAIFSVILMPFGAEGFAIQVMEQGVVWLLAVAHWFGGLKGAEVYVHQWPQVTFVCFSIALILFMAWQGWRGKAVAAMLMAAGFALAAVSPVPDMRVSESGKLVAIEQGGQMYVSSGRREKFVAESWMRMNGHGDNKPLSFQSEGSPAHCDSDACRMELKGVKISVLKTRKGMIEDCGWADLVVADFSISRRACVSPDIISLFDVRKNGAASICIQDSAINARYSNPRDVRRPWTVRKEKD